MKHKLVVDLTGRDGTASVLATLVCLPVMLLLIGLAVYFGRAYHAKFALEEAASAGARWAQTSLGEGRACDQTLAVMRKVLEGYALTRNGAQLSVAPLGAALGRTRQIEVRAQVTVDQGVIPVFGRLLGDTHLKTRYVVSVDPNISRQRYGWQACRISPNTANK